MENNRNAHPLRIAVIGCGDRGIAMMKNMLEMKDVEIVSVCDLYPDRTSQAKSICDEYYSSHSVKSCVTEFTDYRKMLSETKPDGALIAASWEAHGYLGCACMEAGTYPAIECGGACSAEECWNLVRTYERTGTPCMFLENCCYGRNEMTILRMIRENVFGEIIHCRGGYQHDLRHDIAFGYENRRFRYENFVHRCAEFYPAHELGPIMKYLNINDGNRFVTLNSFSSKARGLHNCVVSERGESHERAGYDYTEGDVVTTFLKCAHGETVVLTHDMTSPRPYSRGGRVQGTKGLWMEDSNSIYLEDRSPESHAWESFEPYLDSPGYEHPLWTSFRKSGIVAGHGGMDWLVLRAYIESMKSGTEPPIDVYDGAVLMAVTALSEQSIAMGGAPVAFPDFTDGKWIKRSVYATLPRKPHGKAVPLDTSCPYNLNSSSQNRSCMLNVDFGLRQDT